MKNIMFIAPPAAGKGTQSERVHEYYNVPHISTGDLLREEVFTGSELGQYIKKIQTEGGLVDDETTTRLLMDRLAKPDCSDGFIMDGYPRNLAQAKIYDKILNDLGKDIGVVIFLDIDLENATNRITSRIMCPACGFSYNTKVPELTPTNPNICDKCGSSLEIRYDDTEEGIKKRFDTFYAHTKPLIDFYIDKGVLRTIKIDENSTPDNVFIEVKKYIEE